MTDKIRTPWTAEQVTALNEFQRRGDMHPFTCGHEHPAHPNAILEATTNGWRCYVLDCEYTQDWAHAFMADPEAWPKWLPDVPDGAEPEDTCWPVEVDGETIRVRGSGELSGESQQALTEVARAVKVKFAAEAPEQVGVLQNRLRLAHQARRAKEHQLDDVRRALCDIGFMDDDDPYSHADLADVIRQNGQAMTETGDGPSVAECADNDRRWFDHEKEGT